MYDIPAMTELNYYYGHYDDQNCPSIAGYSQHDIGFNA